MRLLPLTFLLILCTFGLSIEAIDLSKKTFHFDSEPIDVVIPASPKDLITLEACIEGIESCLDVRRIIVVSKERLSDNAEWFDENLYSFSKEDIAVALMRGDYDAGIKLLESPQSRVGWFYQQMLKFYALFEIPGISSNVLVVDSDTVFLHPITMLSETGGGLFSTNDEYHKEYFYHAERLLPGFKRVYPEYSGIAHHMILQRPILDDLFMQVENFHGTQFWKAFCECVNPEKLGPMDSSASEYEIYFNYALTRTDQVRVRHLIWEDIPFVEDIEHYRNAGYQYVSCHDWLRKAYINFIENRSKANSTD